MGLGVGIVARMAVNPTDDADLIPIDATGLFPARTTWVGFRPGLPMRRYTYDFLQLFAPHLDRRRVDLAVEAQGPKDMAALFADVTLPVR